MSLYLQQVKDKKEFLRGAEIAYESILTSFANGDLIKLKNLLSSAMFTNFSEAIKIRNKEGIKSEFTFIGVKESSVDFAKGVATVTYDEKKTDSSEIIEGLKKNTSYSVQLVNATTSSSYNSKSSCGGAKKVKKSAI